MYISNREFYVGMHQDTFIAPSVNEGHKTIRGELRFIISSQTQIYDDCDDDDNNDRSSSCCCTFITITSIA